MCLSLLPLGFAPCSMVPAIGWIGGSCKPPMRSLGESKSIADNLSTPHWASGFACPCRSFFVSPSPPPHLHGAVNGFFFSILYTYSTRQAEISRDGLCLLCLYLSRLCVKAGGC